MAFLLPQFLTWDDPEVEESPRSEHYLLCNAQDHHIMNKSQYVMLDYKWEWYHMPHI